MSEQQLEVHPDWVKDAIQACQEGRSINLGKLPYNVAGVHITPNVTAIKLTSRVVAGEARFMYLAYVSAGLVYVGFTCKKDLDESDIMDRFAMLV